MSRPDTLPPLNAVVTQKTELTPRLMILRVVADGWDMPHFEAGQYTVLGLPVSAPRYPLSIPEITPPDPGKLIRRAYSIASSSLTREFMDFYINLVSNGALTPRLFALEVGDHLWLSERVVGLFTLDQVAPDRHIVMIATGTGLAPYMSMLRTHLRCNSKRQIMALHGAYHSWDLGFRDELLGLQHLCSNFTYVPTIDQPQDEPVAWHGQTGWVQDLWRKGVVADAWGFPPTPENCDVFLCGNPAMIAETTVILETDGFREHTSHQTGQIHIERF
jgi:ferredoxin--NADP+ reductase